MSSPKTKAQQRQEAPSGPERPDPRVGPERALTVNTKLTLGRRRKRLKDPDREPWDKAGAIVRQIDAMAVAFTEQRLDTDALVHVIAIEQAVARLRYAALQGLHGYYSNAQIAEKLGISRQAVDQARRRR